MIHEQLAQILKSLCSSRLLVAVVIFPLLGVLLVVCISHIVFVETVSIDGSSLVDDDNLCSLWNQEDGASSFKLPRVVAKFTLN